MRWHFRQAVFANMRGDGKPVFGCDPPPGSDMVGEVMGGPRAAEGKEFELFGQLAEKMNIALLYMRTTTTEPHLGFQSVEWCFCSPTMI